MVIIQVAKKIYSENKTVVNILNLMNVKALKRVNLNTVSMKEISQIMVDVYLITD